MRCLLLKSPKALRDDKGQKQAGHAFACGYMRATFFMDFWTHPGIRIEIHAYGELGYSHREPLRAGVAAPHPYFQKGIRESAKSKRRESVRAAPKRLRQQVATERSDSDGRERQARVGSTYLLRLCDELRRRETPASALSAVFSK